MVDAMLITARDAKTGALLPMPAQINAVADKAAALVRLQQTPQAQRRVAMMVYNYPQGEGNFGASFLNVPKSLHNMLAAMKAAGYQTEVPTAEQITRISGIDSNVTQNKIDLRALGTNSSRVIITSASGATKLLVELSPGTFDGSFDGATDLAVAFIGTNALTMADILF